MACVLHTIQSLMASDYQNALINFTTKGLVPSTLSSQEFRPLQKELIHQNMLEKIREYGKRVHDMSRTSTIFFIYVFFLFSDNYYIWTQLDIASPLLFVSVLVNHIIKVIHYINYKYIFNHRINIFCNSHIIMSKFFLFEMKVNISLT